MAKQLKRWQGWLIFGGSLVLVFVLGLVCSSLLERRAEVASIYNNRSVPMADSIVAETEKFQRDFPLEYETWAQTEDTTFQSEFNGSSVKDALAQHPDMVVLWAGYAFSWDYNTPRGHRHCNEDQLEILRTGAPGITPGKEPQPATCWTCKGSDVPRVMAAVGAKNFYSETYSHWGSEMMHSIGCSDCHDPRTMELRVVRPALHEAWAKHQLGNGAEWPEGVGTSVKKASHQEMRSLVCAQCHTEYYFSKNPDEKNYLKFPQDKGMTCEAAEAYYDSIGFYDYINPLSKTPILKAQHPGYEMFKQGIHGQRGLSCADCHMPYMQKGGLKFTDHHIMSPLAHIDRSCQTCHRQDAETLRKNVYERQRKVQEVRAKAERELALAHLEAKFAFDKGATDEEMKPVQQLIRKGQWRWDYAVASHGAAFHAPQEAMRLLSNAATYGADARILITRILAKHGFTGDIPVPDVSTKAKAQHYLETVIPGLNFKQKRADKQKFIQTILPKWVAEGKKNGHIVL